MSRLDMNRLFVVMLMLWSRLEAIPTQTNVDTEEPSVIRSPATADPDDGFGWAAILHQVQVVEDTDTMSQTLAKTRVIIGAPRGSFPGGLVVGDPGFPAISNTGLVYSCPIGPGSCEGITGDRSLYDETANDPDITNGIQERLVGLINYYSPPISEGRLFDQAPDSLFFVVDDPNLRLGELKSGQLMGSFLYSSGNIVLACAPKWVAIVSETELQPRGICFSGMRDLTGFRTQLACPGDAREDGAPGPTYCSSGSSAVISDSFFHIGGPGFESFTGRAFTRSINAVLSSSWTPLASPVTSENQLSYGHQLEIGSVTSTQENSNIVVTSPRHNGSNYVGAVYVYDSTSPPTPNNIMVEGMQMAEFFGYSLALCDLTGDGFDELLVGAPMYTNLDPLIVEQGRLYVFFNNGGDFDPTPVLLYGSGANGRFGFAVRNAGDLDADGHEDLIVSAPYEKSSTSSNTGAVYVYYGRDTREAFETQTPQKIHADEIVSNLNDLSSLRSFGFSLSGNIDVDQNRHTDIVAGAYEDQAVVVLRTRPFINITVNLDSVDPVILDVNSSFSVTVRATYSSVIIDSSQTISFTLRELQNQAARLFFSPNVTTGEGMLEFTGAGVEATATVQVFTIRDVSEVTPYNLILEFNDVPRVLDPVSGNQPVSDLSAFPRIRVMGEPALNVVIIDPCGTDGCLSDVVLMIPNPNTRVLTAGSQNALTFDIAYANIGIEEARNLRLSFTGIPTYYFTTISLTSLDSSATFDCTDISGGTASCQLQNRVRSNEARMASLALSVNDTTIIGNEADFVVGIEMFVDTDNNNRDIVTTNNQQNITISVTSMANIGVTLVSRAELNYEGMVPMNVINNPNTLGESSVLTVRVTNDGPSTILNARVEISFPSQDTQITGSNYFLYPSMLSVTAPTGTVNCTDIGLDPDNLVNGDVVVLGRRKRSDPMSQVSRKARRAALDARSVENSETPRSKRQASEADIVHSCLDSPCLRLTCDIRALTTQGITLLLSSNVDERFFGTAAADRSFMLIANASVSVTEPFQRDGDDLSDNTNQISIRLSPPAANPGSTLFIHAIIWPIVAGLLIMVVIVILLYFVGFFRRKKKPGDGEIEGDFTAPTEVKEIPKEKEEIPQKKEEEITVL